MMAGETGFYDSIDMELKKKGRDSLMFNSADIRNGKSAQSTEKVSDQAVTAFDSAVGGSSARVSGSGSKPIPTPNRKKS